MPGEDGESIVHPDDEPEIASMTTEFDVGFGVARAAAARARRRVDAHPRHGPPGRDRRRHLRRTAVAAIADRRRTESRPPATQDSPVAPRRAPGRRAQRVPSRQRPGAGARPRHVHAPAPETDGHLRPSPRRRVPRRCRPSSSPTSPWSSDAADAHAACGPDTRCPAADSAARSAAACARCRAITAEPTIAPPTVSAISTAIIAAATTLADPRSESRLDRRHRLSGDRDARQQDRPRS